MPRRMRYRGDSLGLGQPQPWPPQLWPSPPRQVLPWQVQQYNQSPWLWQDPQWAPAWHSAAQPFNLPWSPTTPGAPMPGSGQGYPQVPPGSLTYSAEIDPQAEFHQAVDFFERPIPPEPAAPANQRTAYQTFLAPGVINLPAIGAPDTTIVTFRVPANWDGWITQIANSFNGPGFVPGSGDIVWRLLQNGQAVKDFDNITVLLGIYSPGGGVAPLRLEDPGVPIYADDTISLVASNVNTIAAGSQVYGFLGGKRFPRGGGWGVSWWS